MAKVISKIFTAVAYMAGAVRVEIKPGENAVPDAVVDRLMDDPDRADGGDRNFQAHVAEGHLVLANDAPTPVAAKPTNDPRARKPRESDRAYEARMKLLDDEAADAADKAKADKEFVAAYDLMTPEEKKALYDTLGDDEKALVDAPRPA